MAEPRKEVLADGVEIWLGNGLVLPLAAEVVGALMDFLDADARAS